MKRFSIPVKRTIALMVAVVLCGLSVYQGIIEKKVPVEFMAIAGMVVGTYFKGGETNAGSN